jgi:outer membrane protein OmpU
MNNFKKVGLTALAASLVSVSAHAGEVSVAGGASIGNAGYSGNDIIEGNNFSMGNQLTFTGSGELDNGLTVSISFVLDQADPAPSPFDSHSVSIASDALGTLTFNGEGGSTTAGAIDTTAAGDLWDKFDGMTNADGQVNGESAGTATAGMGDNGMFYNSPELIDGLTIQASYEPKTTTEVTGTGYGLTYTGVEGLTVKYAVADDTNATAAASGDSTVLSLSYAYGSFTAAYSDMSYDIGTASADVDTTGWKVTYTVTDELSVSYAQEEISQEGGAADAEYTGLDVSYTSGGMTLTAGMYDADAASFTTADNEDYEKWTLGASFAF